MSRDFTEAARRDSGGDGGEDGGDEQQGHPPEARPSLSLQARATEGRGQGGGGAGLGGGLWTHYRQLTRYCLLAMIITSL